MAFGQLTPYRRGTLSQTPTGGFGTGSLLFDLQRQMNRLFDDVFGGDEPAARAGLGFPLDIRQDEQKIEVSAELPGVRQEDIEVSIEDGVLTLSGEKRSSREDEKSGYSERSFGRFERRITLPPNADEEHCQAQFRDGVLMITIPKTEEKRRGRRIPLGASEASNRPEDQLIEQKGRQETGKQASGQRQAASGQQSAQGGQQSTGGQPGAGQQSGQGAQAQKRM